MNRGDKTTLFRKMIENGVHGSVILGWVAKYYPSSKEREQKEKVIEAATKDSSAQQ